MPKKSGIILMTMGAVLIISALLLFLNNEQEDQQAGQQAEQILQNLKTQITQQQEEPKEENPPPTTETAEDTGILIYTDYDYMGIITIPQINIELPVMDKWDYHRLRLAPCRQNGSPEDNDLIIVAHNYTTHFGKLGKLTPGNEIRFTRMDGTIDHYTVTEMETIPADALLKTGHDLTLYTCTYSGNERIVAYCDRSDA